MLMRALGLGFRGAKLGTEPLMLKSEDWDWKLMDWPLMDHLEIFNNKSDSAVEAAGVAGEPVGVAGEPAGSGRDVTMAYRLDLNIASSGKGQSQSLVDIDCQR